MSNSPLKMYVAYKTADAVDAEYSAEDNINTQSSRAKYSVFTYTEATAPGSGKKIEGTIGEPVMFAIPNDLNLDLTKNARDISTAKLVGGRAKSRRGRRGGRRNSKKTYKK